MNGSATDMMWHSLQEDSHPLLDTVGRLSATAHMLSGACRSVSSIVRCCRGPCGFSARLAAQATALVGFFLPALASAGLPLQCTGRCWDRVGVSNTLVSPCIENHVVCSCHVPLSVSCPNVETSMYVSSMYRKYLHIHTIISKLYKYTQ